MGEVKYYHGGPAGIRGWILPPQETGAKSLAAYSTKDFCDTSKVYVSTCFNSALLYASGKRSRVYEVEPFGELAPDPDHFDDDVSFMCDKARIVRSYRVSPKTKKLVRKALFS